MSHEEAWDTRYAESDRIWSGQPNVALVSEISVMSPGSALDLGCGEGADQHLPTPDEVIASLELGDGWEVLRSATHPREQKDQDGNDITRVDATVKLRRSSL